jgi:hypothetical protein
MLQIRATARSLGDGLFGAIAAWRRRWRAWWGAANRPLTVVYTPEPPEAATPDVVYLIGKDGERWSLALLCPCGCGDLVQASLHRDGRPRWFVRVHVAGTVSVTPSIWRTVGCRSHFSVVRGDIIWH